MIGIEALPHINLWYLHEDLFLLPYITAASLALSCRLSVMGKLTIRLEATDVERFGNEIALGLWTRAS